MLILALKIIPDNVKYWYEHPTYNSATENEDTGLDIPMPYTIIIPKKSKAFTIDLGIKAEQNHGYMLVPRSSISKTPMRLSNSIGIIDKSYRGKVLVKVDNNSNIDFIINEGSCYFQIVAFNGVLPTYTIVNNINDTKRGTGGFGSTTRNI